MVADPVVTDTVYTFETLTGVAVTTSVLNEYSVYVVQFMIESQSDY